MQSPKPPQLSELYVMLDNTVTIHDDTGNTNSSVPIYKLVAPPIEPITMWGRASLLIVHHIPTTVAAAHLPLYPSYNAHISGYVYTMAGPSLDGWISVGIINECRQSPITSATIKVPHLSSIIVFPSPPSLNVTSHSTPMLHQLLDRIMIQPPLPSAFNNRCMGRLCTADETSEKTGGSIQSTHFPQTMLLSTASVMPPILESADEERTMADDHDTFDGQGACGAAGEAGDDGESEVCIFVGSEMGPD
ncbi:hypothetical protein C8Q76DRAFT_796795 [Earliella scabrosa]|nr:hypothetical protein C8Q76DRAFT_796795 [Earliella scabrosa]